MPANHLDRSSARGRRPVEQLRRIRLDLGDKSYSLVERGLDAAAATWAARRPANGVPVGSREATFGDVLACYRLLLGRPPDPGGIEHHRRRLSTAPPTVHDLVEEFLGSVEFVRSHPARPAGAPGTSELVKTSEGFRIHVDPSDYAVGHTIAVTGKYEPEVSETLREVLDTGDIFVDVGANIGWFSLLGSSLVGPTGRVVAVEPNPWNVGLLGQSARANGFENIEVVAVALGDAPGAVALETDGSNGRVIPVEGPPARPVEASFVVATYPLDTVLSDAGVTRVDVMKIDVEGAEPLVLRGAHDTIAEHMPILITEFYPLALDSSPWGSAEGYLGMLRGLGYRLAVIGFDDDRDDESILSLAHRPGVDHVDLLARPI